MEHIEIEVSGHIGTLWLNRPAKKNALSADMWEDIPRAVEELERNREVRVLVVAARGDSFTVGIDLQMLADLQPEGVSAAADAKQVYHQIKRLQHTVSVFAQCRMPVIAAIHGHCLGAGVDLITACDIRLATAGAVIGVRETRMGLVADVGTTQRLPRLIAPGHTAELLYTGADITGDEATRIGLVNRSLPDLESLLAETDRLAGVIAANSPLVVEGIKSLLRNQENMSTTAALEQMAVWNAAFLGSNDFREALGAHLEGRPADFSGT